MKYISIDIECTQPSGKIIQLGAAQWDTDKPLYTSSFEVFIDPGAPVDWRYPLTCGKTLEEYVGFTPAEWDLGRLSVSDAASKFRDWLRVTEGSKRVIQWGSGDWAQVMADLGPLPSANDLVNVQRLYKILYRPAMKLVAKAGGLGSATKAMGLPWAGVPHTALADAVMCGWVFHRMFNDLRMFGDIQRTINGS